MLRIESKQNPRIRAWRKLQTAKNRRKQGRYLVEGDHLLEEALSHQALIETVLYVEDYMGPLLNQVLERKIEMIQVSRDIFKELAMTETPQGIMAVIKMDTSSMTDLKGQSYLICDAIQDPGNLGTMIRTADAAGWDGVLLAPGCVDLYNDKVLRASQGSIWHLPIVMASNQEIYDALKSQDLPIYVTALHQEAKSYRAISQPPGGLVLGNEGQGVGSFWLEKADQTLYIPMSGQAESLNVAIAAGVLLFRWSRLSE